MDEYIVDNDNRVHTPEYVPFPRKRVGEELKPPAASDNYKNLSFSEFGSVEVGAKIPDKIVKKAHARPLAGGPYRAIEMVEVFNGVAGRKTVDFYAGDDKPAKSDVEAMDAQKVESARAELASLWASDFGDHTDLRLRGIEKVNDRVVFAVASKNKKGMPEIHFFNCVTGFVIKIETTELSTFLEDYRPYQQGMLPFAMYYRRPEPGGYHSWIKFEVSEWKIGGYLDDSLFEIPLS